MQAHLLTAAILATLICGGCVSSAKRAGTNLLHNPGFENPRNQPLPPQWQPISMGKPAVVTSDSTDKHGGRASIRLDADDFTRSYIRSAAFPVAPGEVIDGSAWVKLRDVPPEHGTVIMIGEFVDPTGEDATVEKFNVADLRKSSWQKIAGSLTVPQNAVAMRLRLGFSYAKGACWWDDVTITAKSPLVARLDLAEPRLSPARNTLPMLIINRNGSKERVRVRVALNDQSVERVVKLDGKPTQRVDVAVKIPAPGKVAASVTLLPARGEKPHFSAEAAAQVPFQLVFPPVSPTHWVVEDGPAKIDGRVDLAMSSSQRRGATLRVQVRDAAGKIVASWQHASGDVPDGLIDFVIDAPDAREGDYALVAELIPRDGKRLAVTQPWHVIPRRLARVIINDAGYPVYDGKAIFPLGIFNGGRWQEQAEAGFTITHAYNAARIFSGPRPQDAEAKKWLDQSEANGMKMMLMIPMRLAIREDWDGIRRRVRMFRNHPGLLAWDEEEGCARGDFKPDTLKKLRQIIDEEDPHHPFMVGDCRALGIVRDPNRSNFFPVDLMDMGMWWWYPFPLKARPADELEGEEASAGTELELPSFLTQARTNKPIWVGVQSYKKKEGRYPTPEEYRCQAYLALTAGAKGLMWYGGSVTGGLFLAPEEGRWDALKKVVREVRDLAPELLGQTLDAPQVSPSTAPINVLIKQSPQRTILIAVNRSTTPADATLKSPLITSANVKRVYEQGIPSATDGAITDHFPAFGVHVYELTR